MNTRNFPMAPVLMTALAALAWGVWWIPVRYLASQGMTGTQAGMMLNLGGALAVFGLMISMRLSFRMPRYAFLGAIAVGFALSFYSIGLALSDVVRVILLFYLAPAWSKVIEWLFMGHKWRWSSTLTVTASLTGALLILGGRLTTDGLNIGDILALLSGLAWAIGAALIFSGEKSTAYSLTLVTMAMATIIAAAFALIIGEAAVPSAPALPLLGGLAIGALYAMPCMFASLWSAQRLAPALLSFLFTLEIFSGVISGALLLDEAFGVTQMMGAVLIVGAALSEVYFAARARTEEPA